MTNSEKHLQLLQNEFNELTNLKVVGYFMTNDLKLVNERLSILENEIHNTKYWVNIDFGLKRNK